MNRLSQDMTVGEIEFNTGDSMGDLQIAIDIQMAEMRLMRDDRANLVADYRKLKEMRVKAENIMNSALANLQSLIR